LAGDHAATNQSTNQRTHTPTHRPAHLFYSTLHTTPTALP
jgi:hypothetical protein